MTNVNAQNERTPVFIGINPSMTVEPFYEKGEFDINVFPLVYQRPLSKRFDLRLTMILNLGIRNSGNDISHWGLESALPFFIRKRENKTQLSKGFFTAPIISLTSNRIEKHTNLGLWVEPGYNLLFENKFALSFGLQIGRTYLKYADGQNKWGNHFGVKIIFGRWK